jgi:polysaccharide export outer membrane protein
MLEEVRIKIEKQLLEDYFKKSKIFCDCKIGWIKYTINGEIGGTGTRVLFQACYNPRGYC